MAKKKILIISLTDQDSDPRVVRQISILKDDFDIYCCGKSNSLIPVEKFYRINIKKNTLCRITIIGLLILLRLYKLTENYILKSRIEIKRKENEITFDLILANDIDSAPVAYKLFNSKKILADFHEYAPSEFEDKLYWNMINKKFVIHQCKKYFPEFDALSTVCDSIADEYNKKFNRKPVVITNAAEYKDLKPSPVNDKIRMIHHGAAISSRKIEIMIESAKLLSDRFTLDLMLIPNETGYYNDLKKIIVNCNNIKIIEPVIYKDIITFCNSYDIGIFILPPENLNYQYALPNKFFEFIQSRLAIVTGPAKEMSGYIDNYQLGIHTKSFNPSEIANEIDELSVEDIAKFKNNSDKYAFKLSAETSRVILTDMVKNLTEK